MSESRRTFVFLFAALLLAIVAKTLFSVFVPLLFDEAYYVEWSRDLMWGYLDHPPGVAFLSFFGNNNSHFFAARSLSYALSLLSIPVLWSICGKCQISKPLSKLTVLTLIFASFGGILFGALTTPDVGMMFFWIVALHESLAALQGNHRRWLTVGLAVGLGFLSKYLIVVFVAALFWTLVRHQRKTLLTPYPWVGFALFILVLSPNLIWNARHDWSTINFLANRGFLKSYEQTSTQGLPKTLKKTSYKDAALASRLIDPMEIKRKRKKIEKTSFQKFSERVGGFLGGALGIWGLLFIPMLINIFDKKFRVSKVQLPSPETRSLLWAMTVVPLLTFGFLSVFTKIEANWFAMYIISGALLYVMYLKPLLRSLTIFSFLNVLVAFFLINYSINYQGPVKAKRLLVESKDFAALTEVVSENASYPLFGERYQLTAQLNYYLGTSLVEQWPGLTRDSEFTRRGLRHKKVGERFSLVGDRFPPPSFEGYKLERIFELRRCNQRGFQSREALPRDSEPLCRNDRLPNIFLSNFVRSK